MSFSLSQSPLSSLPNTGVGMASPLAGSAEQSALNTLLSYMQSSSPLESGTPAGPTAAGIGGQGRGAPSTGSLAGDLAGVHSSGMGRAALGMAMNPASLVTTVPATMAAIALNALSDTPAKSLGAVMGIRGLANAISNAMAPGAFGQRHGEIAALDPAQAAANAAAKGMSLSDLATSKDDWGGVSPGGEAGFGAPSDSTNANSTATGQDGLGNDGTGAGGAGMGAGAPGNDSSDYAKGGRVIALAGGGKLALGMGGGLDDLIPTSIDGREAARLSDGEFVIPADVVSMMGDGSSNEGSRRLYDFVRSIRQNKTGTSEQAGPLPVGDILRRVLS